MNDNIKKALLIFGGGFLLFLLLKGKPKKKDLGQSLNLTTDEELPKNRKKISPPSLNENDAKLNKSSKNAFAALKAYIDAYNNGEPQKVLDELNREFANEFKVKVYRRKSDNKLIVCDLDGKLIIVNNE
jgi:hypothetical protein